MFERSGWLPVRDAWIGWTARQREDGLRRVVRHSRFLMFPCMMIPNLGAHILSLVRRRLPEDWTVRCGTTPVLCGTFVEVQQGRAFDLLGIDPAKFPP